jgi:hypothetical protein
VKRKFFTQSVYAGMCYRKGGKFAYSANVEEGNIEIKKGVTKFLRMTHYIQ